VILVFVSLKYKKAASSEMASLTLRLVKQLSKNMFIEHQPLLAQVPSILLSPNKRYSKKEENPKKYNGKFKVRKIVIQDDDELSTRGNRFYMPNGSGPAWQNPSTTIEVDVDLSEVLVFGDVRQSSNKFTVRVKECPVFMFMSLIELFPNEEGLKNCQVIAINLQIKKNITKCSHEFLFVARQICRTLRKRGFWANFMNPFSGAPFYMKAGDRHLHQVDWRYHAINMKLTYINNCVIMAADNGDGDTDSFSGVIFSNAPDDLLEIKELLLCGA